MDRTFCQLWHPTLRQLISQSIWVSFVWLTSCSKWLIYVICFSFFIKGCWSFPLYFSPSSFVDAMVLKGHLLSLELTCPSRPPRVQFLPTQETHRLSDIHTNTSTGFLFSDRFLFSFVKCNCFARESCSHHTCSPCDFSHSLPQWSSLSVEDENSNSA